MYGSLFAAMICISVVVVAALAILVIMLLKPKRGRPGNAQGASVGVANPARNGWMSWVVPALIALILAIWTIWGALFFLTVIWIMRMNPGSDSSFTLSENEKKTARRIYTWLLLSSFITLPAFIISAINLSSGSTTNERVLSALIPLIFHLPLLLGLTSKSVFVYRHTQQAILLMAVRAGVASIAISIGSYPGEAISLFVIGNGSLWLFSSIWGWNQISNGKCWLMQSKGEALTISPDGIENLPAQKHIEQSKAFIQRYKADEAKKHALAAFRSGDREIKSQAVKLLDTLGEVEKF